jgi:ParB family chromosome partitioning protein
MKKTDIQPADPYAGLNDMLSGGLDPLAPQAGDQQNPLALDQIIIKKQIREEFEDAEQTIEDLAESIKKQGVLQPIRVRPMPDGSWELVCGERRCRAALLAGLTEIPVIWREMTDEEAEDAQLAENIHRKNLEQIETAKKLQKDLDSGLSVEEVMLKHSVNRSWLSKLTSLLKLPEHAKRLVSAGLTSDVEAINTVKTIERVDPQAAKNLVDRVAKAGKGKLNLRDEAEKVKRVVKPPKAKPQPEGLPATAKDRSAEAPGVVVSVTPNQPSDGSAAAILNAAYASLTTAALLPKDVWAGLDADSQELCEEHLRRFYNAGSKARSADILPVIARSMRDGSFAAQGEALFALLAFVSGSGKVANPKFSVIEILGAVKP